MIFSQIGLILDLIGAILLFKYGLPSEYSHGDNYMAQESDEECLKREQRNLRIKRGSNIGLFLLITGFFLQFIGNLAK